VHRVERERPADDARMTSAELLWYAAVGADAETKQPVSTAKPPMPVVAAPVVIALDEWLARHDTAFATGARRRFVSATTLAKLVDGAAAGDPGVAKEGRDLELPPWNKGRYGTAIGRAVHAVLQTVDLSTGAGLADLAAAQAAAEGVLGFEGPIAELVRSALDSATVRAARAGEYWRETYVAVPLEQLTLEGYVDLIYRDRSAGASGGLVVVDYKTDVIDGEAMLAARLAHYRVQGAAYAIAVATATGERVERCVFVFLSRGAAREIEIAGVELAAATEQVRALMRSVRDDPPAFGPVVLTDA
jgi:hypothetical protein